jgi:uncharacterized membrane protein
MLKRIVIGVAGLGVLGLLAFLGLAWRPAIAPIDPPAAAAIIALILSRQDVAPLAYVAGSLGTLVGADLLNLDKVRGLGAPVASIGGAGTFDGIFLSGVLAVLLASVLGPRRAARLEAN